MPISIIGVAGLNDALHKPVIKGFCGTCHDAPNVGDHSVPAPLDIGLTTSARRTPDLPLITLRNNMTDAIVRTSDPGRALITGSWADIGKFKGPILRGLAARAPYFHNGSAATLMEVVRFLRREVQASADHTGQNRSGSVLGFALKPGRTGSKRRPFISVFRHSASRFRRFSQPYAAGSSTIKLSSQGCAGSKSGSSASSGRSKPMLRSGRGSTSPLRRPAARPSNAGHTAAGRPSAVPGATDWRLPRSRPSRPVHGEGTRRTKR